MIKPSPQKLPRYASEILIHFAQVNVLSSYIQVLEGGVYAPFSTPHLIEKGTKGVQL